MVLGAALDTTLSCQALTWGPVTTFGLPAAVLLAGLWSATAGILGFLLVRRPGVLGVVAVGSAGVVMVAAGALTSAFGYIAHQGMTATLVRSESPASDREILIRVGSDFNDGHVAVYVGGPHRFEQVPLNLPESTRSADADEFKVSWAGDGAAVITYPRGHGGTARVEVPTP